MIRTGHTRYFPPSLKIKYYNVIDGQIFFNQAVENDLRKYDNI